MTLGTTTTATHRYARGAKAIDSLSIVATAAAQIHSWAATAEARRRTGRVLKTLDPKAWHVAQCIRLPDGGRADHLAIGPSGVYLLDSRVWQGVVTVDHKGATITPAGRPGAAWTARGQHCSLAPAAAALGRTVAEITGRPLPTPRPVVVIWAPFPDQLVVSSGITYLAGDHLGEWLGDQPRHLLQEIRHGGDHDHPAAPLVAQAPG